MTGEWYGEHLGSLASAPSSTAIGGFTSAPLESLVEPEGDGIVEDMLAPDKPVSDPLEFKVEVTFDTRYARLRAVLDAAYEQAATGKGDIRHGDARPFEGQIGCWINRHFRGHALGQAMKKIDESRRLDTAPAIRELLGAIVEISKEIITLQDGV